MGGVQVKVTPPTPAATNPGMALTKATPFLRLPERRAAVHSIHPSTHSLRHDYPSCQDEQTRAASHTACNTVTQQADASALI